MEAFLEGGLWRPETGQPFSEGEGAGPGQGQALGKWVQAQWVDLLEDGAEERAPAGVLRPNTREAEV